uniref:ZM domain-containing protein n=1 Tax=Ascaris lumbricoides TaxID=6252 RepID=A0A0M3I4P2_ASCLU
KKKKFFFNLAPSQTYSNVYQNVYEESSKKTIDRLSLVQEKRSRSLPYNAYMPGAVYPQRPSLTPHLPLPTNEFTHPKEVVHCMPKRYKQ